MAKKRRNRNGPSKGAVVLYRESPQSKWIHQWWPPRGSAAFFSMGSDADFKRKHPVGYGFLIALGITALLFPCLFYILYTGIALSAVSAWLLLGCVGAFIIGIGLFNFVAVILKQYLGHWVSILCILFGGIMVAISLKLL